MKFLTPTPVPNRSMSNKLVSGVLLSSGLLAIFMMVIGIMLAHKNHTSITHGAASLTLLISGVLRLQPSAWLYSGTWLLILTPILALISAAIGATLDHDWRLLAVIFLLLIILSQGIFIFSR